MTARDSVAGLGGTATALADSANPVYRAQPGAIGDIGARFTKSGTATSDSAKVVDSFVAQLDGAWQGTSADAFVAYMAKFTAASTSLSQTLTAAATDLSAAATGLQSARDTLEGVFGELYDNALSWINGNPDATDAEKRQHVDSLAAGYRGRVTTQIENAEAAVSAAASALSGRKAEPKFSSIPEPGTQSFTPGPGKPIEWTPTLPEQTSPSSADQAKSQSTSTGGTDSGGGGRSGGGGSGG
ncbi:MAG TPA: WXG100 family type VII secretion target, partial [Actinokineospora sp.]|nr:WXG100 family type VII secretion target [Actinokineospora sp.]